MDLGLRGAVALVTGAAGDIGAEVAHAFAAEGMCLALVDNNEYGLTALASDLRESGASVSTVCLDLSKPDLVTEGIKEVLSPYDGHVDIVVNNAGICPAYPIEHLMQVTALADWRAVYDVNFYGYLSIIQSVLPAMQEQGGGVIINNASDLARQPVPEMLHYSTAKAAILHLTVGLAPYLGQFNIRLLAVAPGPTRTAIWTKEGGLIDFYTRAHQLPRDEALTKELRNRGMAIPRLTAPEDVANLMLYLASPHAHAITRTVVDINGGSHHGY